MQYVRITASDVFNGSYGFVNSQVDTTPPIEYIIHLFREDNVESALAFTEDEFEHVSEEEYRTSEVIDA